MTQLHLTLKPKASAVFADPARSRIATCGRRFGKSYLSVAKALQRRLHDQPTYSSCQYICISADWRLRATTGNNEQG
tara:strand:- start:374 stop:604 length:231 start_codon:yes stop_codon:yes gene_type:complete